MLTRNNINTLRKIKVDKNNLLFRADMNSLDNSSCFLSYIRGVSQNMLLQNGKHKWEFRLI